MSISREIKRRQRNWAASRGITIDRNGYVIDDPSNLYLPLSSGFAEALLVGDAAHVLFVSFRVDDGDDQQLLAVDVVG